MAMKSLSIHVNVKGTWSLYMRAVSLNGLILNCNLIIKMAQKKIISVVIYANIPSSLQPQRKLDAEMGRK